MKAKEKIVKQRIYYLEVEQKYETSQQKIKCRVKPVHILQKMQENYIYSA